ncbi:hypothetical protein DICPUDRAFT_92338 [Dictyostelium purpureum]|uniref:Uncharacterized protein n=1 Tax=Dictyostelium purpureum TaxID=5786 RepID=F0ZQC2_DICPU|nr:uncharacterized protein DICPUDRAFT_92338 [Dictyostelium purpureum]EGC33879.1 hypothetical protein DICPUDRAFT_92338 [Dictyostelium purpureum]|eukprot:XP_003289617.1 hypothetical protein DICPUDRAFT_92338 [Dictyostelium purpureum]
MTEKINENTEKIKNLTDENITLSKEKTTYFYRINNLEQELDEKKEENTELKKELEKKEDELKNLTTEKTKLEQVCDDNKIKYDMIETENKEIIETKENVKQIFETEKIKIKNFYMQQIKNKENEITEKEEEIERLLNIETKLKESVEDLTSDLELEKENNQKLNNKLSANETQLNYYKKNGNDANEALKEKCNQLEHLNEELIKEKKNLNLSILKAEQKTKELENDIKILGQEKNEEIRKTSSIQSELENLKLLNETNKKEIQKQKDAIDHSKNIMNEINSKLDDENTKNSRLSKSLEENKKNTEKLTIIIQTKDGEIELLDQQIKKHKIDINKLKTEEQKKITEFNSLKLEIENQNELLKIKDDTIEIFKKADGENKTSTKKFENQIESLKKEIIQNSQTQIENEKNIENLNNKINNNKIQYIEDKKKLEDKIKELTNSLDTTKKEFSSSKHAHQKELANKNEKIKELTYSANQVSNNNYLDFYNNMQKNNNNNDNNNTIYKNCIYGIINLFYYYIFQEYKNLENDTTKKCELFYKHFIDILDKYGVDENIVDSLLSKLNIIIPKDTMYIFFTCISTIDTSISISLTLIQINEIKKYSNLYLNNYYIISEKELYDWLQFPKNKTFQKLDYKKCLNENGNLYFEINDKCVECGAKCLYSGENCRTFNCGFLTCNNCINKSKNISSAPRKIYTKLCFLCIQKSTKTNKCVNCQNSIIDNNNSDEIVSKKKIFCSNCEINEEFFKNDTNSYEAIYETKNTNSKKRSLRNNEEKNKRSLRNDKENLEEINEVRGEKFLKIEPAGHKYYCEEKKIIINQKILDLILKQNPGYQLNDQNNSININIHSNLLKTFPKLLLENCADNQVLNFTRMACKKCNTYDNLVSCIMKCGSASYCKACIEKNCPKPELQKFFLEKKICFDCLGNSITYKVCVYCKNNNSLELDKTNLFYCCKNCSEHNI